MPLLRLWKHLPDAGYCCVLQALELGRTIQCFLPLAIDIDSDSMKASPQGRVYQVRFNSVPPNFVSEICGLFINGVLLSSLVEVGNQGQGNSLHYLEGIFDCPEKL